MAFTATFLNLCNAESLPFALLTPFTQHCHLPFSDVQLSNYAHQGCWGTVSSLVLLMVLFLRYCSHSLAPMSSKILRLLFQVSHGKQCELPLMCESFIFLPSPFFISFTPSWAYFHTWVHNCCAYVPTPKNLKYSSILCFLCHLKSSHQSLHLHLTNKKVKDTMKKVLGKYIP